MSFAGLLKETAKQWNERKALRLSAALAYYSIFSIAPLLLICLALAGWFFGQDAAQGRLDDQLRGALGPEVAESMQSMVKNARAPSGSLIAGIIGTATLLLGAGGVFAQLKDALNTIWNVPPRPGKGLRRMARARLSSFAMVLVIGFLLLLSVAAAAALSSLTEMLGTPPFITGALASALSVAAFTLLFAALFKILPDTRVAWRDVWIGALFTAALFELGKLGLGYYLGRESTASAFGAAAALILVLLWVYYAALIFFFGAVFTKVCADSRLALAPPAPRALTRIRTLPPDPQPFTSASGPLSLVILGAATGLLAGLLLRHTRLPSPHAHPPHHRHRRPRHARFHQSE